MVDHEQRADVMGGTALPAPRRRADLGSGTSDQAAEHRLSGT